MSETRFTLVGVIGEDENGNIVLVQSHDPEENNPAADLQAAKDIANFLNLSPVSNFMGEAPANSNVNPDTGEPLSKWQKLVNGKVHEVSQIECVVRANRELTNKETGEEYTVPVLYLYGNIGTTVDKITGAEKVYNKFPLCTLFFDDTPQKKAWLEAFDRVSTVPYAELPLYTKSLIQAPTRDIAKSYPYEVIPTTPLKVEFEVTQKPVKDQAGNVVMVNGKPKMSPNRRFVAWVE